MSFVVGGLEPSSSALSGSSGGSSRQVLYSGAAQTGTAIDVTGMNLDSFDEIHFHFYVQATNNFEYVFEGSVLKGTPRELLNVFWYASGTNAAQFRFSANATTVAPVNSGVFNVPGDLTITGINY